MSTSSWLDSLSARISRLTRQEEEPPTILPLHYTYMQRPLAEATGSQFRQGEARDTASMDDSTNQVNASSSIRNGIDTGQLQLLNDSLSDFMTGLSYTSARGEELSQQLNALLQRLVIRDDSPPNPHRQHSVVAPAANPASTETPATPGKLKTVSFAVLDKSYIIEAFESRSWPVTPSPPPQRRHPAAYPRPLGVLDSRGPRELEILSETGMTTFSSIYIPTPRLHPPVDDQSSVAGGRPGSSRLGSSSGRQAHDPTFLVRLDDNDSRSIASSPPQARPSNQRAVARGRGEDSHRSPPRPLFREDVFTTSSGPQNNGSSTNTEELQLLANGTFKSGYKLATHQLSHLQLLVAREVGADICRIDQQNSVGRVLSYKTELERMGVVIALIACNLPPPAFTGEKSTMIVVKNKRMMKLWNDEIRKLVPHKNVFCYESGAIPLDSNVPIIILTWNVLQDVKESLSSAGYFRIVLDAAAYYKDPASRTGKAVCKIKKRHGLCLIDDKLEKNNCYIPFRFLEVSHRAFEDYEAFKTILLARTQVGKAEADKTFELLKEDFYSIHPDPLRRSGSDGEELSWSAWSSWSLFSVGRRNEVEARTDDLLNPIQDELQIPGTFAAYDERTAEADAYVVPPHTTSRSSPQVTLHNFNHRESDASGRPSSSSSDTLYSTAASRGPGDPSSDSALSYLTDEGGIGWGSDVASRSSSDFFTAHSRDSESLQNWGDGRSSAPFSELGEGGTSDLSYLADEESAGNESDVPSRLSNDLPSFLSRPTHPNLQIQGPKSNVPSRHSSDVLSGNPGAMAVGPSNTEPLRHHLLTTGRFGNGFKLKKYQLADLRRLVQRESGEKVCGTNVVNRVGYLLAYQMGLGKTALAVALIACNRLPKNTIGNGATLIIVPNQGVMDHWVKEIQKFSPHLDVCCYKSIKSELRQTADVILITYRQILLQYEKSSSSSFFQNIWLRVICGNKNESHDLRNPSNKTVEAVCALRKMHGLCLSGTPMQNSALDLYSIFKFLGVTYEGIDDLKTYKRLFCSKSQKGVELAEKSFDIIEKNFCISRSFGDADDDLETESDSPLANPSLTERTDITVDIVLSPMEELVYDYIKDLPLSNLVKILRLRQVCDHPSLVYRTSKEESNRDKNAKEDGKVSSAALCDFSLIGFQITDVITKFSIRYAQDHGIEIRANQLAKAVEKHFAESFRSAKLKEMTDILLRCQGQKTIIFTHFTSFLPAITKTLYGMNIGWTEYTGDMDPEQKKQALKRIKEDPACTAIVVSILSGNTGLDITSCNNVILMEPWWNPFTEEQAIARAYRVGQTLPVKVFRLVVKNSIEESILKTQQAKKHRVIGTTYQHCELEGLGSNSGTRAPRLSIPTRNSDLMKSDTAAYTPAPATLQENPQTELQGREPMDITKMQSAYSSLTSFLNDAPVILEMLGASIERVSRQALDVNSITPGRDIVESDSPPNLGPSRRPINTRQARYSSGIQLEPPPLSSPRSSRKVHIDPRDLPSDAMLTEEMDSSNVVSYRTPGLHVTPGDASRARSLASSVGDEESGTHHFNFSLRHLLNRRASTPRPRAGPSVFSKEVQEADFETSISSVLSEDAMSDSHIDGLNSSAPMLHSQEPLLLTEGKFNNGKRLTQDQMSILRRLVQREAGDSVCGTSVRNDVGFVIGCGSELDSTASIVALIAGNLPPEGFEGIRTTLVVVKNQQSMDWWVEVFEAFLPDQDIITYSLLLGVFKEAQASGSDLFKKTWFRIIAGDADQLRNPATQITQAILEIPKQHALCLVTRDLEKRDYYAHFRFLGVTYQGINDWEAYQFIILAKSREGKAEAKKVLEAVKKDFCIFRVE
ncbi:hypothetical protein CVT26_015851 [Gymnopilus dilepis]|uniref:Uncharacterized protein n=1 Tax=Gymnopilus dilepis TaxID=231916 RepID=A0A409XYB7_9AGAR|nr:hypothetical protein CVT26_015851 [Gymnopilus dilepis]